MPLFDWETKSPAASAVLSGPDAAVHQLDPVQTIILASTPQLILDGDDLGGCDLFQTSLPRGFIVSVLLVPLLALRGSDLRQHRPSAPLSTTSRISPRQAGGLVRRGKSRGSIGPRRGDWLVLWFCSRLPQASGDSLVHCDIRLIPQLGLLSLDLRFLKGLAYETDGL